MAKVHSKRSRAVVTPGATRRLIRETFSLHDAANSPARRLARNADVPLLHPFDISKQLCGFLVTEKPPVDTVSPTHTRLDGGAQLPPALSQLWLVIF